jgi:hypothetical protein
LAFSIVPKPLTYNSYIVIQGFKLVTILAVNGKKLTAQAIFAALSTLESRLVQVQLTPLQRYLLLLVINRSLVGITGALWSVDVCLNVCFMFARNLRLPKRFALLRRFQV